MSQFYFKRRKSRIISLGNGFEAYALPVKCVVVGDCAVGKTSLLISYTTGSLCNEYIPTIFETYHKEIICDGVVIDLELCDIAGDEDMKKFRSTVYLKTDIFILCFSVVSPKSFHNVIDKWIPELKQSLPNKPILLVGTKSDLRDNSEVVKKLSLNNESPIDSQSGQKFAAKLGAIKYVECSAFTKLGVNQIFDESVRKVLELQMSPIEKKTCIIS